MFQNVLEFLEGYQCRRGSLTVTLIEANHLSRRCGFRIESCS